MYGLAVVGLNSKIVNEEKASKTISNNETVLRIFPYSNRVITIGAFSLVKAFLSRFLD